MHIKHLISSAAIALAAGVGSASADENLGTLDGISAFDSLAGIQAVPLDTDERASITVAHYLKWDNKTKMWVKLKGHKSHYTHKNDHGVKLPRGGGLEEDPDWGPIAEGIHNNCLTPPCPLPLP